MGYTFAYAQGYKVGKSLLEKDQVETVRRYLETAPAQGTEIVTAVDVVWADDFSADAKTEIRPIEDLEGGELGAEILVGILELNLLGDGHAVVGDGGGAPLLVEHDVAALGAEGHLDGVGEDVNAAFERTPRLLVELQSLCHGSRLDSAGDDGEDVARVEQQVVGAVVLDFGAPVLAEDDAITLGDVERDAVSLVVDDPEPVSVTIGSDPESAAIEAYSQNP